MSIERTPEDVAGFHQDMARIAAKEHCCEKPAFEAFHKIPRLFREFVITEKIDGTNAQIFIGDCGEFRVGSRNRWLTPENDNFGFARWAYYNKADLLQLGPGRHFGEWWGQGIQRSYGLPEKRFSLFNVGRWFAESPTVPGIRDRATGEPGPRTCFIVPTIHRGIFSESGIQNALEILRVSGSLAAPGFLNPEGIVIYHEAAKQLFKVTLENDASPKSAGP